MSAISSVSCGVPVEPVRTCGTPAPVAAATPAEVPAASALVCLQGAANAPCYARPAATAGTSALSWAAPHGDALSMLMLDNASRDDHALASRWHGLGGALLQQLAETGRGYRQALSLDGSTVGSDATKVSLRIATRSGAMVNLEIALDTDSHGRVNGLQVAVSASDELSDAEREALGALAGGLDQALDGLGQGGARLDLSGLMALDTAGVLGTLDLVVDNPKASEDPRALRSFSLQLGPDRKAVSLEGWQGAMALQVGTTAPAGEVGAQQRLEAIDGVLRQVDAAAERGHADAGLVRRFKEAFRQLQAPPPQATPREAKAEGDLASQVGRLQSGLADFEAQFGGDAERHNDTGGVVEASRIDYRIGQATRTQQDAATGRQSIVQTLSEATAARVRKARIEPLNRGTGNFDETRIDDRRTITTLIETDRSAVTRALRKTDEHRWLRFASLEKFHEVMHRESPSSRSLIEKLR